MLNVISAHLVETLLRLNNKVDQIQYLKPIVNVEHQHIRINSEFGDVSLHLSLACRILCLFRARIFNDTEVSLLTFDSLLGSQISFGVHHVLKQVNDVKPQ